MRSTEPSFWDQLFHGGIVSSDEYWFFNNKHDRSSTWTGATSFSEFIEKSKRGYKLEDAILLKRSKEIPSSWLTDLRLGDIIQINYKEMFFYGEIEHTMIITEITDGEIMVSYHTGLEESRDEKVIIGKLNVPLRGCLESLFTI
jgi:hypothetical protein